MSPEQPTTPPGELRFKRVLLKLSGEALMGDEGYGISPETLHRFAEEIRAVRDLGADLAIVVGGGNIFRGAAAEDRGLDRVAGDHMGMLATLINAIALQDVLERCGLETRVLSALEIREVAEPFIRRRALRHLERGRIVILAAGTGNPYFTTDSAAALRAMELRADVLLKATQVDGIYSADPKTDSTATFIKRLRYLEVLERGLRVMDTTAISLCMDNEMPIVVFDVWKRGNIGAVVRGEDVGSLVSV